MKSDLVDHANDYRRALGTLDLPALAIHGRQDVVAVGVEHRRPADHGVIAVRVEPVDDDDAGVLALVKPEVRVERRPVA